VLVVRLGVVFVLPRLKERPNFVSLDSLPWNYKISIRVSKCVSFFDHLIYTMSFSDLGLTSETQLIDLARKMGMKVNYVGFAESLNKLPPNGLSIINLGDESRGGTHWVMLWVEDATITYMDSYGVGPEDDIIRLAGKRRIIFNKKQIQRYEEEHCGVWVLLCAKFLSQKKDKATALNQFISRFILV